VEPSATLGLLGDLDLEIAREHRPVNQLEDNLTAVLQVLRDRGYARTALVLEHRRHPIPSGNKTALDQVARLGQARPPVCLACWSVRGHVWGTPLACEVAHSATLKV
jgi:hypothetical protein